MTQNGSNYEYTGSGLSNGVNVTYFYTYNLTGQPAKDSTHFTYSHIGAADTQAPTAPTFLTSPSKTSTSVSLSWTASTDNIGVTGYEVYKGATPIGSPTGTTFTVTGLSANTEYTFTVKAKDEAGNLSAASNAVTVTTSASMFSNTLFVRDGASSTVEGTLSTAAGAAASTDTTASAGGNWDGTVHTPNTYVISGLTGTYDSTKSTAFNVYADSGTSVGNAIQVCVSYDFTGDGTYDRVEMYNYFATDPVAGFELYNQTAGLKSAAGSFANLNNGKVKIEVWNALGNNTAAIQTDAASAEGNQSKVVIPFS
ncbi:fibronectin type III domain-containing protein [Paenibacillus rhizophilus]|uniref:Fibronectin type III domain-containing protein n=2 Tax=Paenibacillus rhizophilus TaxID=1850366 RepID=A0A3N9P9F6_9BACL|nr:fibronectin type III domain-containing protein [Paenibacillus rhizophilus]